MTPMSLYLNLAPSRTVSFCRKYPSRYWQTYANSLLISCLAKGLSMPFIPPYWILDQMWQRGQCICKTELHKLIKFQEAADQVQTPPYSVLTYYSIPVFAYPNLVRLSF
jgi:hypothetical protein